MTKQVYRIDRYQFSATDALLFDANIWLYIYGPEVNSSRRYKSIYSLAFGRMRSVKARIFIDVLVLSEFINTYARLAYNKLPQATRPADFKSFRNSNEFQPVAQKIAKFSRRILGKCDRTDSGFESVDLDAIVVDYAGGNADFNDQILAELCKAKGLKFVTHDADF